MYENQLLSDQFWLGTQTSYVIAAEALARGTEHLATYSAQAGRADDIRKYVDELAGPVFKPEGNVGHIHIKGSLINGQAGFSRLYGVLGYDDIRAALTDAVADKNVKSILLVVDSGGGQVAGCQELARYISDVDKVKPVFAYTGTTMGSAAYWIGSRGRRVFTSETATVGSVGVLILHQEMTKMLDEAGVKVNVIRSGKYKALGNRYEQLSELGREELQAQCDQLASVFNAAVAEARGVSVATANSRMGQGREFIGQQAVDAGLADRITSYSEAHELADVGDSNGRNLRRGVAGAVAESYSSAQVHQGPLMKLNLTQAQLAALAAGASVSELGLAAEEQKALSEQLAADQPKESADTKPKAEADPKPEGDPKPAADTAVADVLRAELREVNLQLATATAKIDDLTKQLATATTDQAALHGIARASIGKMQVALGGADTSAALPPNQLLAEHERLSEAFKARFKVGGVAATGAETVKAQPQPIDPKFAARIQQLVNANIGA